jgi:hypothetical protein
MAKDDDDNGIKYKEGVDFEIVDKGGYQTRRFFTKKEKEAMKAPKAAAPKKPAAKAKPKLPGIVTPKVTTTALPPHPGTKVDLATLRKQAEDAASIGRVKRDVGETFAGKKFPAGSYKKGGMIKEGSAKDMREDKAMAKKRGMTMKAWEKSAADKKHDAPKKMMSGGVVKKATGGSMRGAGCAVRGKGFSGSY